MCKKVKIILTVICVLMLFCVLSVSAFAEKGITSISKAKEIDLNTNVSSYSDRAPHEIADEDYFKIAVPQRGVISLTITHENLGNSSTFANLRIEDETGKTIYAASDKNNESEKTGPRVGVPAGTYYINVAGFSDSYVEYNLRVNYSAANDWEQYPNNDLSIANPIETGIKYYGSLTSNNSTDKDCFKFELADDGSISVTINHKYVDENNSFADITVFSYDGTDTANHLSFKSRLKNETVTSDTVNLRAGVYYLKITDYEGYNMEYSFTVNYKDEVVTQTVLPVPTQAATQAHRPAPTQKATVSAVDVTVIPAPTEKRTVAATYETLPEITVPENGEENENVNIYNNFIYVVVDSEIVICGYNGEKTHERIPEEIENKPVTGVAANAFADSKLQVLEIPACIKKFGEKALESKNGKIKIKCDKGSAAEKYAVDNNLEFEYIYDTEKSKEQEKDDYEILKLIIIFAGIIIIIILIMIILILKKRNRI